MDKWQELTKHRVAALKGVNSILGARYRDFADELANEALITAAGKWDEYTPAKGDCAGWVYGIAQNTARNFVRTEGRRTEILAETLLTPSAVQTVSADSDANASTSCVLVDSDQENPTFATAYEAFMSQRPRRPEEEVQRKQLREVWEEGLRKLGPRQQTVWKVITENAADITDLEISAETDLSLDQVKKAKAAGRESMQDWLEERDYPNIHLNIDSSYDPIPEKVSVVRRLLRFLRQAPKALVRSALNRLLKTSKSE